MSPSTQPSSPPCSTSSRPPDSEPGGGGSLAELERLGNDTLFALSRSAARDEKRANADLVCALAVLHRRRACAKFSFGDIWGYLFHELNYSKDAATRRSSAAKLLAEFPEAEPWLRSGAVSMSSFRALGELLRFVRALAGPGASDEECSERVTGVLEEAEGLTVREVKEMVKAEVPSPCAQDLQRIAERFMRWARRDQKSLRPEGAGVPFGQTLTDSEGREVEAGTSYGLERGASEPTGEDRYELRMSTSPELLERIGRVQDLASHMDVKMPLEDLMCMGLDLLIEKLEKRKYGAPMDEVGAEPEAEAEAEEPRTDWVESTEPEPGELVRPRREASDASGAKRPKEPAKQEHQSCRLQGSPDLDRRTDQLPDLDRRPRRTRPRLHPRRHPPRGPRARWRELLLRRRAWRSMPLHLAPGVPPRRVPAPRRGQQPRQCSDSLPPP